VIPATPDATKGNTVQLQLHTPETAPERSRPILDGIASEVGFIPNLAAAAAESPVLLAAFDGLRRAVATGELDPVHREVAGLAVGVAVDNAYGIAFHSTVLANLGVDESAIERMRAGRSPVDPRCGAVYDTARAVAIDRGKVDPALIERATALGFTDSQLLEIVAECAFASLVGLIDNLAGRVELDPFLAPRAVT
jgi:alkylhydroperoxidase family enzyme